MNANEIIDGLWIGDVRSSEDKHFLLKNNISVVVNCTKNLPNVYDPLPVTTIPNDILEKYFIKYYRVGCDDNGREEEIDNFINGTQKIINSVIEEYKNGKKILVHCVAGQQRSCGFVLCMLKKMGYDRDTGFMIIVGARTNAFNYGREVHFERGIKEF